MAENFSKEIQESQYILSKINITHTHTPCLNYSKGKTILKRPKIKDT